MGSGREDGFTLLELLVAAGMSIVLLLALTTMLITTTNQTQRIGSQVNTTRSARSALATIENELHSACIGGGSAPIQANSTGTDLIFLTYNGTSDAVGSASTNTPVWHDISFANGTLTDTSYNTTNSGSGYAQSSQIASVQLLGKVSVLGSVPIFQYFAYQAYQSPSDGYYYWTIPDGSNAQPVTGAALTANPLTTPLTSSAAQSAVEVAINMTVGPTQYSVSSFGVSDPVTDSVSLRLTSPPNYTVANTSTDFGPCQ